jgi:hypothetical protein
MLSVAFAYLVGMVLIADSTAPHLPLWLQVVNVCLGLWFIIAGSIAGWQRARQDD